MVAIAINIINIPYLSYKFYSFNISIIDNSYIFFSAVNEVTEGVL